MSGGALGSILGRLIGPPLTIAPLAKNILMPLGLSTAMSGIDGVIQKKKIHGTGTTVIFSNEEKSYMIKIVKALEDSDILMKGSTEKLQNDVKKRWHFANFTNVVWNFRCIFIVCKRNV